MTKPLGRGFAVALAMLAGFVDALGYLSLGRFYVGFMSGNSTQISIGTATGSGRQAGIASGLVAAFVLGVAVGTLFGRTAAAPRRMQRLLLLVAGMLAVAALLPRAGLPLWAGLVMAMAMGAENTVSHREGQSGLGLTYMTGTLVRVGQRLAEAVTGEGWRPVLPDLALWLGMLGGALLGALSFGVVGLGGLWIAVGATLVMAAAAWQLTR